MIVIKGPSMTESEMIKSIALPVFRVDRLAVVQYDSNGSTVVVIKTSKQDEVFNALKLVTRSLLPFKKEGEFDVRMVG